MHSSLICGSCRGEIVVSQLYEYADRNKSVPWTAIFRCNCASYPMVWGILCLQKSRVSRRTILFLRQGQYARAALCLVQTNNRLHLFFSLFFFSTSVDRLARMFGYQHFYDLLGFKSVLRLLKSFSFPASWVWYLANRHRLPSYHLSTAAITLASKPRARIVDIGCGVGQIFPVIYHQNASAKTYGIDKSFINLLLARAFFVLPKTLLICADADRGFPFKNESLDVVLVSDSFHYFKHKNNFIRELARVTSPKGEIAIIHTLNNPASKIAEQGITPMKIGHMLKSSGFNSRSIISNNTFWALLKNELPVNLRHSDPQSILRHCYAYSVVAAKQPFPKALELQSKGMIRLKQNQLVYTNDPLLKDPDLLRAIINNFDNFIFLSPHLDDAVLSCGMLLHQLSRCHKKISVITIFTQADPQITTAFTKRFVAKCGYVRAKSLFNQRKREDQMAMSLLKANCIHLGFKDAAWRTNKLSSKPLYPGRHRLFSGKPRLQDNILAFQVTRALEIYKSRWHQAGALLFAPLGIGGHVDHVITQKIAAGFKLPVFYWEDFPYNLNLVNREQFLVQHHRFKQLFSLNREILTKRRLVGLYKSQLPSLFPEGIIPYWAEKYYQESRGDN